MTDDDAVGQTATQVASSYGWVAVLVAALAVVSDQLTKVWALHTLPDDGSAAGAIGPISFRLLRNPGAAFSLGEGTTWIFTVIAFIVVFGIGYYVLKTRISSLWFALLIGLIGGGAVGNLIDRLFQPPGIGVGHVVDFLDYGVFVGNVADIWIVAGAIGLAIYFLTHRGDPLEKRESGESDDGD